MHRDFLRSPAPPPRRFSSGLVLDFLLVGPIYKKSKIAPLDAVVIATEAYVQRAGRPGSTS
jgi:hypothetical protein